MHNILASYIHSLAIGIKIKAIKILDESSIMIRNGKKFDFELLDSSLHLDNKCENSGQKLIVHYNQV